MKMKKNIQHSTFNAQGPRRLPARTFNGCWMLNVECWMFPLLIFSSLPVSAQTAPSRLSALAPPCGELPPTFWQQHGTVVVVGGLVVLALAAVVVWKILRPKPQPVLPPAVVARAALARLQRQPEDGKILSEASQALRRYVIATFELPPDELTTAEFCAALAGNKKIGAELAQSIADFLRECDGRKFSGSPPAVPLNAAGRALELVALGEKRRAELLAQTPADK
jgi:hypothetical protein